MTDNQATPMPGTPLPWRAAIWQHRGGPDTVCIKAGEREIIGWTGFDGVPCTKAEIRKNARYVAHACNNYPATAREADELRAALHQIEERFLRFEENPVVVINWMRAIARAALGEAK